MSKFEPKNASYWKRQSNTHALELVSTRAALDTALMVLNQIASTLRNVMARRNALAAVNF